MKLSGWKVLALSVSALSLFILAACGGSGSGTSSTASTPSAGMGELSLSLTDATLYQYQAVYVTIDQVSVHMGATETGGSTYIETTDDSGDDTGGWKVVATPMQTVNLLELVNGVLHQLVVDKELEAGHYTQIRLLVGDSPDGGQNILNHDHPYANYVIEEDNSEKAMKVPSGMQSGIKLVKGFDIPAGGKTELILDFDAAKSVVKRGKDKNNDKKEPYLLKPTIKVLDTRQYAMINGTVEDEDGALPGALVSVQYTTDDEDEAGQVKIETATITEVDDPTKGEYLLYVNPGSYNLVAFTENYDPACASGGTTPEQAWTENFLLLESTTGATLTGAVSGIEDPEQPLTISVRQELPCPDLPVLVEILSEQITSDTSYSFYLPAGDYRIVASSVNEATQAADATLPAGGVVEQNFTFD